MVSVNMRKYILGTVTASKIHIMHNKDLYIDTMIIATYNVLLELIHIKLLLEIRLQMNVKIVQ